jgi:hypothetical protein
MIAEKQSDVIILNDGDGLQTSTKMSLDSDSANVIMQMLSKNLYADSIGSTIRETASNGLDSHRRAGVTDVPIIVSLKRNKDDNYEFCVEDFGTGLDADDIENIISKYGKSTKRLEANALGMFGLGFKSPLAYSNSFLFVCRKNSVERKYMMYEGDDGNTIDLLYEAPTSERNGVKIIIPIKFSDRYSFQNKIKEQLCYFESVYFDVNVDNTIIKNEFVISRGKSFQYSELNTDQTMHICLDNVYYPIDWSNLGIKLIDIPIGLRFTLQDGLYPTPNRESLRYTTEAKVIIKNRIKEVSDYFITKYNTTITDTDNIRQIFDYYNNKTKMLDTGINNVSIDITELIPFTDIKLVKPKLKGVKHLNLQRLASNTAILFQEYSIKYELSYGRFSETKHYWNKTVEFKDISSDNYLFENKFSSVKKTYLRETLTGKRSKFIKKEKSFTLFPSKDDKKSGVLSSYFQLLNLHTIDKKDWRTCIKEFQSIQQLFLSKLQNLDDFVVPQTWIDAKKAAGITLAGTAEKKKPKSKGEISAKIGVPLLRYVTGKNCKFDPTNLKLDELQKHNCLYVYSNSEDSDNLDKLYSITEGKQKLKVLLLSERELKVVEKEDIHNLISLSEFMEGKNKVFKRIVTATLIDQLVYKYQNVFGNVVNLIGISTSLADDINMLLNYRNNNFVATDDVVSNAMLETAAEFNLYDGDMYPEYIRIKSLLEKLTFLNPVMRTMSPYLRDNIAGGPEMKSVLCDLFKYYKCKIDYTNYKLKIEEPVEEKLEEELIEELTN